MAAVSILRATPRTRRCEAYHRKATIGLTAREREIMDLWDGGLAMAEVARRLGIPRAAVANIVTTYAEGNETRTMREAMIAGSTMLAAAIELARAA